MGVYIIEYSQDPNYVIGVTDQSQDNPVVLRSKNGLAPRYGFWDVNFDTGIVSLNSSGGVLAIGADRIAPESLLKLKPSASAIQWDFFSKPGYIVPRSDESLCLDDKGRVVKDGNPIWLFPINGSPAQQWRLVPLNNLKSFE
ncbi:RICIN domain-containing protein [Streptomyces noursei]|uniref:RICIN domain-containing protein n=3 Tax=Bacteria TaxID=2 RepID=A0AAP4VFZ5_9BURK|nr:MULTISPECIES: RICIN domain-containing protein [Burkholderia]MBD1411917.1 RICIN domain-containing protein [Burkholderia contaminans]MBH9666855.1 RICIN domain-containing protein [Burkholderia contaminans]MBH9673598.1 RICIN domain-containing protein [Burkholderia contaminans]MBH9703642.1 RICIN domain-containing protein [Burkholderia contaminans]MBH9719900.1 RICIN domain-containing protein [Burkholderia contaminans]